MEESKRVAGVAKESANKTMNKFRRKTSKLLDTKMQFYYSLECVLAVSVPLFIIFLVTAYMWYQEILIDPRKDPTVPLKNDAVFKLEESTITGLHYEFTAGRLNSKELVQHFLDRIRVSQSSLNLSIHLNPSILTEAEKKDSELISAGGDVGILHGIPLLLTDDIGTKDQLNTTGSFSVLYGSLVARDSVVAEKLRKAGAFFLGKVGFLEEEFSLDYEQHSKSSGDFNIASFPGSGAEAAATAVSANLVTVSVVKEGDNSILSSAGSLMVVGLRPTVGLVSREGNVPTSNSQDSVGLIARTLEDAVIVFDTIVEKKDSHEPFGETCIHHIPSAGYRDSLKSSGARGKHLGVLNLSNQKSQSESTIYKSHIATLRSLGAVIIETEVEILMEEGNEKKEDSFQSLLSKEHIVTLHEFKPRFEKFLEELEKSPNGNNLSEVLRYIKSQKKKETGLGEKEERFLEAAEATNFEDKSYENAKNTLENFIENNIVNVFNKYKLDIIVTPSTSNFGRIAAMAGYPGVTIPAGFSGKDKKPFGMSFFGKKCSEVSLIEIGFAFEQATMSRRPLFDDVLDVSIRQKEQKNIEEKKGKETKTEFEEIRSHVHTGDNEL